MPFKAQNSSRFLFFDIMYISVMGESILKLFKTFLWIIYLLKKILFDKHKKEFISLIRFFIFFAWDKYIFLNKKFISVITIFP